MVFVCVCLCGGGGDLIGHMSISFIPGLLSPQIIAMCQDHLSVFENVDFWMCSTEDRAQYLSMII